MVQAVIGAVPERLARVGHFLSQRSVLATWLALMTLLTVLVVWHQNDRVNDQARCQAEWSEQLVLALHAQRRADGYDRTTDRLETQAIVALIEDLLGDGDQDSRHAIERYRDTLADAADRRDEATRQRADNPLPDLPSNVCGGPLDELGGS